MDMTEQHRSMMLMAESWLSLSALAMPGSLRTDSLKILPTNVESCI
jgi:hypothetical protein